MLSVVYLATALTMHVRTQDLIVSSAVDSSSRVNDSTPQRTQSSVPRRSQSSTPKVSGTILLFLRSGNQPSWLLLKKNPLIPKRSGDACIRIHGTTCLLERSPNSLADSGAAPFV